MLLLLDVDATLTDDASATHHRTLEIAVREFHGFFPHTRARDAVGRTDRQVVRAMLDADGVEAAVIDRHMDDVLDLAANLHDLKCPRDLSAHVRPGVPAEIAALHEAGHRFALVSGDTERIARLKLTRSGLGAWLDGAPGGFGSDDEDRAALAAIALARAGAADAVVVSQAPAGPLMAVAG